MSDLLSQMSKRALAQNTRKADAALWFAAVSRIEQLEAALKPFAEYADALDRDAGGPFPATAPIGYAPTRDIGKETGNARCLWSRPNIGDCRQARVVVTSQNSGET